MLSESLPSSNHSRRLVRTQLTPLPPSAPLSFSSSTVMFSISFLIYLIILALISAYTSPTFGVSSSDDNANGFKEETGYQALRRRGGGTNEEAEEYELEDDGDALDVDEGGRMRVDSFEEEMEGRVGVGRSGRS